MHPFFDGLEPTLHIAHRGGAKLAPENTMTAFRQAVERWHTDMLEIDVHLTRDGEVVVFHDDTLDRCTDASGPVLEKSWRELAEVDAGYGFTPDGGETFPFRGGGVRIPRLVEVLRAFPDLRLNVELKADLPDLVGAFAELVRAEGALDRLCVGSEHDETAAQLHDALPDACHFFPRDAGTLWVMSAKAGAELPDDPRWQVLDMPWELGGVRLVTRELLEQTRAAGIWVNVWTVDDPDEMRRLAALGVGGVMTDRPDLLRTILT